MKKIGIFVGVFVALIVGRGFADVVHLKDGASVRGKIISETKYSVKMMVGDLPKVFYSDQIDHVEHVDPEREAAMAQAEAGIISDKKRELIFQLLEVNQAMAGIRQTVASFMKSLSPQKQEELKNRLNAEALAEQLIPVYAKYFTEEDLAVMIQYFSSPAGQHATEAAPQIMKESVRVAAEYFKNIE